MGHNEMKNEEMLIESLLMIYGYNGNPEDYNFVITMHNQITHLEKDGESGLFKETCYFNDDHFSKSYTPIQL